MVVLSFINCEWLFTCGISNTILNSLTNKHLRTIHIVIHNILKLWQVSFKVNDIEKNTIWCCNLNPYISFHEEEITHDIKWIEVNPILFFRYFIIHSLKEQDLVRWSRYQTFLVDHVHLSQGSFSNLLSVILLWGLQILVIILLMVDRNFIFCVIMSDNWNSNLLTLTIENIDFITKIIIERLLWEILISRILELKSTLLSHFFRFLIPNEVMMRNRWSMVDIDKQQFIINKGTSRKRKVKVVYNHRVVI